MSQDLASSVTAPVVSNHEPSRPMANPGHAAFTFGGSLGIQFINAFTGILLARALGPDGKGELTAALLWPALLAVVFEAGLLDATTVFATRFSRRERLFSTVFYPAMGLAAVAMGLGYWLLPIVLGHAGSEVVRISQLYLLFIPVCLALGVALAVLQGQLAFKQFNALRVIVPAFTACGLVALAVGGVLTVEHVVLVYIAANLVTLVLALLTLHRQAWLSWQADWARIPSLLSFGLKSYGGILSGIVNRQGDQLLISIYLLPTQLGLYSVAVTLTAGVLLVGTSAQIITLPTVARLSDPKAQREMLGRLVRLCFWASALTGAAFIVSAPVLINLLFGPAFLPALATTEVLLLAAIMLNVNMVLAAAIRACGWPMAASCAEIAAVVVTLIGLALLLPTMGILGAAVASVLAYGASGALLLGFLRARLHVGLHDLLLPTPADVEWLSQAVGRRLHPIFGRRTPGVD